MAADNKTLRDYLNRATIELHQTRQSLRELDSQRREPIAIVGMSCRYPGGVQSPGGLWQLVSSAVDAASQFPDDRSWDVDGLYDPDLARPGTSYVKEGSFLSDVGQFDAQFFGISPREALAMDPQQRLLLEGAWETLEDAGIDPASLRGTQTGVFMGVMSSDYGVVGSGVAVPGDLEAYAGTGIAGSVASGRVAYTFGLEGPAMSVDTACSSSLVAIHLASQALRQGECSMALAGGVTVMSTPASIVGLSRQRALAPDGRCKAFGAGADGMGTSEGMGMVLLEPLSQAKRNGHEVLAVIRGSATNQDGASNGLTAPNGPSQERVIAQALASARLGTADIDAVEAHGTGTALGDPIEAQALLATYGQERANGPLHLGSIKSNIGHTQAAAGVAGVIKMVQAMRHGVLPRTLHAEQPSEHIEWSAGEVSLLNEEVAWEPNGRPRRAGVSSFGISGTNAHLILEEAPAPEQEDADAPGDSESPEPSAPALFDHLGKGAPMPWVLSAKSEEALREQARRLGAHLKDNADTDPADVGLSLSARSAFEHRAVLVAEDIEGFTEGLEALAEGRPQANLIVGRASSQGKTAFLFPGQGSQWQGMALELWESSPLFAEAMGECEEALASHVDWSLEDVLRSKEGAPSLDRVDVVQPALFAVMVSLARLWRAWGVRPDVVIGHSQGEIAAAHIAGALSLEDAARVVALRSKALGELAGKGGMLSVAIGAKEAGERFERFDGRISLAAVNGPASVVLSGEVEALEELLSELESEEIRARMIGVDYAAHSEQVEAIQAELLEGCESIEPQSAKVPFFSTVGAELLDTAELDAEYWYRNLRETVQFAKATEALLGQGHRSFVELSPHPALLMSLQESAERTLPDAEQIAAVGSLRREDGGPERFLCSLAELWVSGGSIEWREAFEGSGAKRVALPTYPFQRERFWLGGGAGPGDVTALGQASAEHPLLGAAVGLASGQEWLFTGRISVETHPWLADHAVFGTVILPGTAFLELALHAGAHVGLGTVEELVMQEPLVLAEQSAAQIQVSLGAPDQDGRRQVEIYSRQEQSSSEEQPEAEQWTRHASGTLTAAAPKAPAKLAGTWPPQGAEPVEVEGLYDHLAAAGFEYGPAFQGLTGAWRRGEEVFAEVSLPETERQRGDSFALHPALFDAALHSGGAAWLDSEASEQPQMGLPFAWSGVSLQARGPTALRVALSPKGTESEQGEDSVPSGAISIALADQDGAPVGSVDSLTTRPVSESELGSLASHYESLFCLEWVPLKASSPANQASGEQGALALIGSGEGSLAKALASSGVPLETHADPAALAEALGEGEQAPGLVLLDASEHPTTELPESVHSALHLTLEAIQSWLAQERFAESRLILLTRGALSAGPTDQLSDLVAAPLWGLLRSAQSEHPERFALLDIDTEEASVAALPGALVALTEQGESQLALRAGELFAPRLARATSGGGLVPPEGAPHWRLEAGGTGTLEDLVLLPSLQADAELEAGQVRVGVHAAGVNFRDVLITLGMYPEPAPIGGEGAGIVLEVGPGVEGLSVGDRVMGLLPDAFGPLAVTDQRMVAKIPAGWSFSQAASVPIAFLTAHFALTDLAGLKAGEKLLVHAAAGGVGMAAVQLAHHLGVEVFATASEEKWGALERLGLEETHIASSRTLDFKDSFLAATGGEGVDVVLDSLAREFVDASLELLPRGGRFIEMGKTDVRDPEQIAASHPGVAYRAFDMAEAGPERIGEMLGELLALFEQGALEPLPTRVWDVRRAPEAFRFMSQARHTGKNVLSIPQPIAPEGTALITGGTGVLGGLLARHLVSEHGVSQLLLASRQGEEAEGATELGEELEAMGADLKIAACDVGDPKQLGALIEAIDPEHPLKTVIHTAGTLDDGTIDSLTPERLDTVLTPKADAAWHLHELTEHLDLDAFVMFSSAAATVGSPGQGNYAAANTFMDALASYRRERGLPASSLAWGLWEKRSGLTGDLGEADLSRMERGGVGALSSAEGLELFDAAHGSEEALMLPVRLDIAKLRAGARAGLIPPLLRGLLSTASRPAVESGSLARRLAAAPEEEREAVALELLCAHIAIVLGHSSADAIDPQSAFKDLGFDSLSAVELRNRLNTATGLRLPATLVFDYPTPAALAGYLLKEVVGGEGKAVAQIAVVAHDEPIAIVGMSCRYPGDASSPRELWQLVRGGIDAVADFPEERGWDVGGLYDADPSRPGTSYVKEGAFLRNVGDFDAAFFGISPREALAMDPQQRLLLEGAWEAMEDAGIDPVELRGSPTGVFTGVMGSDYGVIGSGTMHAELEGYLATGIAGSVASGRVSYSFGFEGPAMSVDTACSSSLVAIHLASQAMRQGECSMALAGGVTVMSTPATIVELSRQRVLAPDGRCKSFGAGADGMSTSEGMGMVLLEPLSQAKRNGHEVLAVIRGSATNQDGASNGLTAPNGPSQERVIAQALASARLGTADIDAVEAHGTGTALGDPIEAQALLATYGQERGKDGAPLQLGSIKSNIGHTQAAAGVAGVIKMVQALRHGVLPKTLHAEQPSEHIEWSAGEVSLLNEEVAWEPNGRPRRAGISSFGISGTNAHLILEEAPQAEEGKEQPSPGKGEAPAFTLFDHGAERTPLAWPLSAKSEDALQGQAERLAAHLRESAEVNPADIALSLASRSAFEYRAVIVAAELEGFKEGLSALAQGVPAPNVLTARATAAGKTAFLFPGQGSQWPGMATELLDSSPLFAERMRACEEALAPHVDWSLEAVLRGAEGEPGLDRVQVVQSALFAVMVSLARLWRAWGVRPDVVIGHSQGEIAAAHIAGALSLEDAARVVALRSKALGELAGKGGMLSVAIGAKEAGERFERFDGRISLAAVNGPASVVLSGEVEALEELLSELESEEIRARMIGVDYAAHSEQVEAIQAELLEGCESIEPQSAKVPFFSTVGAELLDTAELDAEYWYRNLRETVQFAKATEALLGQGHRSFVELSPHPALLMSLQESAERTLPDAEQIAAVGSLRREDGGPERFLCSLAELWVSGGSIEWREAFEGSGAKRVALPTYPFQRERFWLGGGAGPGDVTALGQASAEHPLLGAAVGLASGQEWLFTGRISVETHPWLADHAVFGTVILPGTAFLELALHAGAHVGLGTVEELVMQEPLVLAEQSAAQIQVSLGAPDQDGRRQVEIYSRQEQSSSEEQPEAEQWTRHASGTLTAAAPKAPAKLAGTWPPQGAEPVEVEGLYDHLAAAGFEYGPAFQGLTGAWRRGEEVFAEVSLPETERQRGDSFALHPALFDAALHSGGAAWLDSEASEQPQMGLPFAWSGVSLQARGPTALRVALSPKGTESEQGEDSVPSGAISIALADQDGAPVGSVDSLTTRPVSESELGSLASHYESLFCLEWVPLKASSPANQASGEQGALALIGSGEGSLAKALASSGVPLETHADPAALAEALGEGEQAPGLVLLDASEHPTTELPESVHSALHLTLEAIQSWLAQERFAESRLILLTRGALSAGPTDQLSDLVAAPLWGLLRSAQSEHPERFALLDIDTEEASVAALPGALVALTEQGESQLALRAGELFAPRLARATSGGGLVPPEGAPHWRLEAGGTGTLEDLVLLPSLQADAELEAGQVRVGVHAAGVNFRDVLITLGMYPEPAPIGGEGAGIVLEVGPGVEGLSVGDRVMGLLPDAFGPLAVTDQRMVAKIPAGWSFSQAASVPIAFLTAHFALTDLAGLKAGEKLLVHAAAGGVGMAAVQLAHHLGVEVFATASEEKWGALERLGLEETHIASSRTLDFKDSFLAATGGEGVDVVLDSLAREFVDASLELLPRGGRFIEMGKTDVRDPEQIAASHPGVAYRAFDMAEAGPERIGEMLGELLALFEQGALEPLPTRVWDVRRAPEAFRFMSQARHTGKNVLSIPQPIAPEGTALITGGTGVLGGLLARHLVSEHGVSQLLLASRQGEEAEGATELGEELEAMGADLKIAACDVGDPKQLGALIEAIDPEHPLKTVIHTAGTLDDGTIDSLTPERLDTVLTPKADAAWHLHELTEHLDLDAFVMFSSAAATVGSPGQGNYAAANTFMDALASYRRERGLPASSLAWGLWEKRSGLTGDLGEADLSRMERGGVGALSSAEGLELFDAAHGSEEALMLPVRLDIAKLRAGARAGLIPPLLRGLLSTASRPAVESGSLARRLAAAPEEEREAVALELLCAHIAIVLGHSSADAIDPQSAFKDLGFDSLSAVELRNRLNTATGLRLPATLVFDYPTPAALAGYLLKEVVGGEGKAVAQIAVVAHDEPIAIVGMSCRYPGGVQSPGGLWQLVSSAVDAASQFPDDRSWDVDGLYDPDLARPGTSYVKEGSFLSDVGEFDAQFFGISPREALAMDPQQRLLLEGAWETLEDAGIDPASLRGTQTGVFAGVINSDYGVMSTVEMRAGLEGYLGTGNTASVASGRVAYTFGLEGPAMSVDTACSSSLVAIHLASQALRQGECSMALAGGVTVMSTPATIVELSRQHVLARDGRCKAFGAGADGMGTSEGMGMVLLEPLSRAKRNGHEVLAVIRGSATNQDGASNGLTAPNGPSQERVIAQALASARLSAADIDAVEAHGTGTALGDPIEAQALLATYGQERANGPLQLGSIKSNIGHTQAAAGVAGVIKMVQALRHGVLPKTLHAEQPSEHIEWSAGEVSLLSEEVAWEPNGRPRRAGVSSFGISGTNAHLILEEAPAPEQEDADAPGDSESPEPSAPALFDHLGKGAPMPWVLSAKSEEALREQARRLGAHLKDNADTDPADVGLSLSARSAFEHRAVLVAEDIEGFTEGLEALAEGRPQANLIVGRASSQGKTAFLLPGQGSQRVGMGKELYEASPLFRAALDEVLVHLDAQLQGECSLREVIWGSDQSSQAELLDQTRFAQAGLFALELALFRFLEALGVKHDFLIGHSIGELSAAHVAGVLSLQDACTLVAARARLMQELPSGGAMVSIQAAEQDVLQLLESTEGLGERVCVAAVNGPASVVVSGDEDAVLEVAKSWEEQGRKTKHLNVSHAFHSSHMEPMLEEFSRIAEGLEFTRPKIPIVSNITGERGSAEQMCAPEYWARHVREPVRFADGVRWLQSQGVNRFLELGPDGVLSAMVHDCARDLQGDEDPFAAPLMRKQRPEVRALLNSLAELWVSGGSIEWREAFEGSGAKRVALPTYPFQRERFWLGGGAGPGDVTALGQASAEHPLLGAAVGLASGQEWLFTGRISVETHPWLADHAVFGTVILPGTAFLELALHAGAHVGLGTVEELVMQEPLVLAEQSAAQIQVSLGAPDQDGRRQVEIYSRQEQSSSEEQPEAEQWTRHASGTLTAAAPKAPAKLAGTWPPQGAEPVEVEGLYDHLAAAGFEYGPAFQGLTGAWRRGEEVFAEVSLPETERQRGDSFALHPALFDAALHSGGAAWLDSEASEQPQMGLPFAWSGVSLQARGPTALRVALSPKGTESEQGEDSVPSGAISIALADQDGAPVGSVDSLTTRPVSESELGSLASHYESLFCLEWVPLKASSPANQASGEQGALALIGSGEGSLAKALASSGVPLETHADPAALAEALGEGEQAPGLVLLDASEHPTTELPESVHSALHLTLEAIQSWLAQERFAESRLILLTRGALSAGPTDQLSDLVAAPLWGLLRSAQSEHPERFALLDIDTEEASVAALPGALVALTEQGESQLALRAGELFAPRLARAAKQTPSDGPVGNEERVLSELVTSGRSVLITGELGAQLAGHLAREHGVRSLVLASKRGMDAPGAAELKGELESMGAQVLIRTCDVSDRGELEGLLSAVPDGHPLGAVIHAAGTLDDGTIDSLTPERLDTVLTPKADAAWYLHELTEQMDLDAFVMFSSAAATVGSPGQGNYAAANTFMDALASYRRERGLPAGSLAWGPEEERALLSENGLKLFDAAHDVEGSLVLPIDLDLAKLRAQARLGELSPMFSGLVRMSRPKQVPAAAGGGLVAHLASTPPSERAEVISVAIRAQLATILGHEVPEKLGPDTPFLELGMDSLAALEMQIWMEEATGLRLPPTLLSEYQTLDQFSAYLHRQLEPVIEGGSRPDELPSDQQAELAVGDLFRHALRLGLVEDGVALLESAATLRSASETQHEPGEPPAPIRLCLGDDSPRLVCIPSSLATAGPHQYVRFASYFRGAREVTVCPLPGFMDGERLPATLDDLLDAQAEAVRRSLGEGGTFALFGHSTGGTLAHAIAARMAKSGEAPAGVILIDTHPGMTSPGLLRHVFDEMLKRDQVMVRLSDTRLTAMAAYGRMLGEYEPRDLACPTLMVKASEPMGEAAEAGEWETTWKHAHTSHQSPGDHFTMMEEHVEHTAEIVKSWMATLDL